MTTTPAGTPERGFVAEHLGLILSALVVFLTGLKVLAVSHGDGRTAAAVIDNQGWAILPSVILTMLPLVAVLPTFVLGTMLAEAIRERDPIGRLPWALLAAFFLALVVGAWAWVSAAAMFLAVMIGTSFIWRAKSKPQPGRQQPLNIRLALALVLSIATLGAAAIPRPWMPLEQVQSGQDATVGYVLGSEDNRLIVLTEDGRTVTYIPTDDVTDRQLCDDNAPTRSILAILLWRPGPTYPDCDNDN